MAAGRGLEYPVRRHRLVYKQVGDGIQCDREYRGPHLTH